MNNIFKAATEFEASTRKAHAINHGIDLGTGLNYLAELSNWYWQHYQEECEECSEIDDSPVYRRVVYPRRKKLNNDEN